MRTVDWSTITPAELTDYHLEELRDYFLPELLAYRTSGRSFSRRVPGLIARARTLSTALARGLTPDAATERTRWRKDTEAELEARRYSSERWQGRRTRGWVVAGKVRNVRREDPVTWLAWRERMQYAQMTSGPRVGKVTAGDSSDTQVIVPDLEPELEDGTGNQLDGVLERLFATAREQGDDTDTDPSDTLICRSIFEVPRFDWRWRGCIKDPVSEIAVDEDELRQFACRAVEHALRLPLRRHNRNVRWNALDCLLDILSSARDKDFVEALADMVFERDKTYLGHVLRIAQAKSHRGRRGRRVEEMRLEHRVSEAMTRPARRAWIRVHGIREKSPYIWRQVNGYRTFRRQRPLLWQHRHPAVWVGRGERVTPSRPGDSVGTLTPFARGPKMVSYTSRTWKLRRQRRHLTSVQYRT